MWSDKTTIVSVYMRFMVLRNSDTQTKSKIKKVIYCIKKHKFRPFVFFFFFGMVKTMRCKKMVREVPYWTKWGFYTTIITAIQRHPHKWFRINENNHNTLFLLSSRFFHHAFIRLPTVKINLKQFKGIK